MMQDPMSEVIGAVIGSPLCEALNGRDILCSFKSENKPTVSGLFPLAC